MKHIFTWWNRYMVGLPEANLEIGAICKLHTNIKMQRLHVLLLLNVV